MRTFKTLDLSPADKIVMKKMERVKFLLSVFWPFKSSFRAVSGPIQYKKESFEII
jgi:hypothetical protein